MYGTVLRTRPALVILLWDRVGNVLVTENDQQENNLVKRENDPTTKWAIKQLHTITRRLKCTYRAGFHMGSAWIIKLRSSLDHISISVTLYRVRHVDAFEFSNSLKIFLYPSSGALNVHENPQSLLLAVTKLRKADINILLRSHNYIITTDSVSVKIALNNKPLCAKYILLHPSLESQNITVKMQVIELLYAVCAYSSKGHQMALHALRHFKVTCDQKHGFDIIVSELRNTKNVEYQTRLLSFINCLTLGCHNVHKRVQIRNELLGRGLGPILSSLSATDDKELQMQVSAFIDYQHRDEMELESTKQLTHHQLFEAIFEKVHIIVLIATDKQKYLWDSVWEALDSLSSEAIKPGFSIHKKPARTQKYHERRADSIIKTHSFYILNTSTVSTQTEVEYTREVKQLCDNEKQHQLSPSEAKLSFPAPPPLPPPPPCLPLPLISVVSSAIPSASGVLSPSSLGGYSSQQKNYVPPPPPIPNSDSFETLMLHRRHSLPAHLPDSASLWTPVKDKSNTLPLPKRKMKTLSWTKIPVSMIGESVWTEMQSEAKSLRVDFKQMEELFCQKTATVQHRKSSPVTLPAPITPKITLLETKRDLAVNIYLKQFKLGGKAVIEVIKNLKGGDIGPEKLKALLPLLPTEKELTSVRCYSGDLDRLGEAEKFYLQLSEVPSFVLRIRAMLLKEEFPLRTSELREQLNAVADACNKLKANKHLKEFLALVLQLGNFINAVSIPNMKLLISVELLQEEVMKLISDVKHVASQLKEDTSGIRVQFKDFFKAALKCSNEIQQAMNKVKACTHALAKHFCEDPKKFKPEECFHLFAEFFTIIQRVRLENEEKRKSEQQQIQEQMETNKLTANGGRGRKKFLPHRQYTAAKQILRDICSKNFKLRRTEAQY
ncbi:inverted formin-2-like [Schistocerca americana]|uniref:inverted formin-2-like n=1 Tax=Schistocerca americana TaxID=7009 RepID=UPI001F4F3C49|nr:inverted formin-2-like [Schistocerca americana]